MFRRTRGGIIKLGGGWQGRGTIKNARNTTIGKGAVVTANAREKGQGGIIAVWADQATRFGGRIEARGGPKGGNGGSVETSGKEQLGVTGTVDASAPQGTGGEWLLDPRDVTISGAGAYAVNPAGETIDPGSDSFTILDSSISAALSSGNNVTITTGTTGTQTGNLALWNATISKTGGGDATLTLKAESSIGTTGTNSISSTSGKLHTIFWSDANNDQSGYIALTNTTITSNGGDVILGGGVDNGADILAATDGVTLLYDGIAGDGRPDGYAWGNGGSTPGVFLNNGDIAAGAGNIIIRGHGMDSAGTAGLYGIRASNSSFLDTNGLLMMDGVGGNGLSGVHGILFSDLGSILQSASGNIALNGAAGPNTGGGSMGVVIQSSAIVRSNGAGGTAAPIAIYGKGGGGTADFNYGVMLQAQGRVSSKDGDIAIAAVGGNGMNSNHAFRLFNATVLSDGNANITISGTRGSGTSSGDFWIANPTSSIGGASATGTITFLADKIGAFTDVAVQTQGDIVFKPRTSSATVGISGGGCGSSCNVNLTDAILATLSPDVDGNGIGSLVIGDSAAGTGTVDINGWDLSGKTYDVEVYGGTVDLTGGAITWNGGNDILLHSRTGDFVIDQNFTRNAGVAGDGMLTIKAAGSITTSGTRTITAATAGATGKLHTILWSDADNSGAGHISLFPSITTNGGDIILGGGLDDGSDYLDPHGRLLIDGIAGDGRPDGLAMASSGSAALLQGPTVQTAGGNITLLGGGGGGVNLAAGASGIDTGGGNIVLGGSGFAQLAAFGDVHTRGGEIWISNQNVTYIVADTYTIDTGGGAIHTVSGLGATAVVTHNGGKIVTGSGNIILEGMGGTNPLNISAGVRVAANLATQGGDIELIAHGGGIQLFDNVAGPSVITTQGGNVTLTAEATTGSGLWLGTEALLGGSPAQFVDVGTLTIRGRGSPTSTADPYGTAAGIVIAGPWDITGVDHMVLDGHGTGTTALNAGILFLDLSPIGAAAPSIGSPGATADLTILADTIAQVATADLVSFTIPSMPIGIQTAGRVTLASHTPAKTIGVAGGPGDVQLPAFLLDGIGAGNITIGDATSGLITVNPYGSWASRASSGVSFLSGPGGITFTPGAHDFGTRSLTATTSGPLTVNGAITAGNALLQTTGASSDITIGAAGSITTSGTGDAITLASARNFINNGGAGALSAPAGRWLVYSGSPAASANGGLIADFARYGCDYGACTGFTPGLDGFLYREIIGGSSGGGMAPTSPAAAPTPPVRPSTGVGGGQVPTSPAPVITTGLPDFIRKQDIVTRIQVEAPLHGSAPGLPARGPDLEDSVTLAATQEGADSRIRADDRRRRWFAGELYTVSPDLARDLESD